MMKQSFSFTPESVCSRKIEFDLEDGKVKNLRFQGGCPGNLAAISKLAEGETAERLIQLLEGIPCGGKSTSCTDQFAKALKKVIQQ